MKSSVFAGSVVLVLAVAMTAGCATKRYGRMQPITDTEAQYYDCKDIEIELSKIAAFRQEIADAEMDGRSVVAFLGDFGIGNAMEKDDALDSAAAREADLLNLKTEKGCSLQPAGDAVGTD